MIHLMIVYWLNQISSEFFFHLDHRNLQLTYFLLQDSFIKTFNFHCFPDCSSHYSSPFEHSFLESIPLILPCCQRQKPRPDWSLAWSADYPCSPLPAWLATPSLWLLHEPPESVSPSTGLSHLWIWIFKK